MSHPPPSRRSFLRHAGGAGLILGVSGCTRGGSPKSESQQAESVCPGEDLMREHGVLNRILLIYDEGVRRIQSGEELDPDTVSASAGIIRIFIEEYHEKLEEEEVFPRFEAAHRLRDLTEVLRAQHAAGRGLTAEILALSRPERFRTPEARSRLADRMTLYARMYRPHEAREDTVLFPALHQILRPGELAALGEAFEAKEERLFGKGGFADMVRRTTAIEEALGLYDLSRFTPKP
jgi:hemerythrin-like domain-containing protein